MILGLYNSNNTVFSTKGIALLWEESDTRLVKKRIYRYVKADKLYSIRKGFYAKNKNYNKYELAIKIYNPSYASFETILGKAGVTFQHYGQIFIASYLTREIVVDGQMYRYRKIKDSILTNSAGIEYKDNYFGAIPERAFLDIIYLNKNYAFDNLSVLDWGRFLKFCPFIQIEEWRKKLNLS